MAFCLWFLWLKCLRPSCSADPQLEDLKQADSTLRGPVICPGAWLQDRVSHAGGCPGAAPSQEERLLDLGLWLALWVLWDTLQLSEWCWTGSRWPPHSLDDAVLQMGWASWRRLSPQGSDWKQVGTRVSVRLKSNVSCGSREPLQMIPEPSSGTCTEPSVLLHSGGTLSSGDRDTPGLLLK